VQSHLLHLLLYSTIVSAFFALLVRRGMKERLRLGLLIWGGMVGGTLALAYLMFPFPP
jgi:hypothetical protein